MPTVREVVQFLVSIGETDAVSPPAAVAEQELVGVKPDQAAAAGDLAWLSPKQARRHPERATEFRGTLLLAPREVPVSARPDGGLVVPCQNPKLAFTRAVLTYFAPLTVTRWPGPDDRGITPGTRLGERVTLGPGVVLGSGVSLGNDVVIGPNTCLANCSVGSNVQIGCNCTIGLPGFGYERNSEGHYGRFPHVGRVVIEDDVEIGSNTCIDRGAIGDTVIGRGSKIDNLVHIAHNVTVGRDVLVIANSMIGGSTTLADDAWIAPSAALMNQIRVGRGAVVGLGAVVLKDVADAAVVVGNPARPLDRGHA